MGTPNRQRSPAEQRIIDRVAKLSAKWESVTSGVDGFGHMTFRAGKKPFVIIGSGHDGAGHIAIKSDHANQDALIKTGRYIRTPYIGQHGWVSADFNAKLDWKELDALVRDGYDNVKPKTKSKKTAKATKKLK